jgi:lipoate---protein ligase
VIGPGCLNYSLVLSMELRPGLRRVAHSYQFILRRMIRALRLPGLAFRETSDLAIGERKVSGNSQLRGRRALLHHGTILYDFDILLMERYLKEPTRQPAYRSGRTHRAFVANAPVPRDVIEQAITKAWVGADRA